MGNAASKCPVREVEVHFLWEKVAGKTEEDTRSGGGKGGDEEVGEESRIANGRERTQCTPG
jgi:hypothetical protein